MRRLTLAVLFLSTSLLLVTGIPALGGDAGDAADSVDTAAQYKKGATSYRRRCARCHGVNMVNPGPGIFDLRIFPHDDKNRFVIAVVNGKNAMPSWGDVLDAHQIDDLWLYVTTELNQ